MADLTASKTDAKRMTSAESLTNVDRTLTGTGTCLTKLGPSQPGRACSEPGQSASGWPDGSEERPPRIQQGRGRAHSWQPNEAPPPPQDPQARPSWPTLARPLVPDIPEWSEISGAKCLTQGHNELSRKNPARPGLEPATPRLADRETYQSIAQRPALARVLNIRLYNKHRVLAKPD